MPLPPETIVKNVRLGIIGAGNKDLRIGVVGVGSMGSNHARNILAGKVPRMRLTAVCDINPAALVYDPEIHAFSDSRALIRSGEVDAVLIATPHYSHTTIGIDALNHGLHVLVEKPISVHKADCERLIAAHEKNPRLVFAAMFNQRTDPSFCKIRSLIQQGELGEIRRVHWTVTNWFRTEAYFASSSWRATWAGEGGGVLLNQSPHNLDLLQWMFGMPRKVHAFCGFGKYHDIEVEDDVTAYLEFQNGATGTFITSTGESPGANRLEICAERGRLVYENNAISFTRNEVETTTFCRTSEAYFSSPPVWNVSIPISGSGEQHIGILKNFTAAILDGVPLIAPAGEGIHSVELAIAMLLSAWTGKGIEIPMNAKTYARQLRQRILTSKKKKRVSGRTADPGDFAQSFK
jgi:predicted dehydrogenase